ncbi:MAG: Rpp14/Pop5 family protein [Candidatus Thermoplasmatota archaeon]|nr:Rpp14/Pop5 family protein [Candidatus Thermoplasmatota archaeon]MDI6855404.1 Rpp14/Pop5 family protein [Candidatus Thermoplasmatota archaeon]MDI6887908.1 Rpp14/Pop5 family protein [Candidatus Thermoplasmatota archaeon]
MVVKDKVGRKRYIAFEVIAARKIGKAEIVRLVASAFGKLAHEINPWVVKYRANKGLLRCKHTKKEEAIKILTSIGCLGSEEIKIKTIGTSGTIKCATRKYLKRGQKPLYSNQCL